MEALHANWCMRATHGPLVSMSVFTNKCQTQLWLCTNQQTINTVSEQVQSSTIQQQLATQLSCMHGMANPNAQLHGGATGP